MRTFTPGRYGKLQRICGREKCRRWYKTFAVKTLPVPRGLSAADWKIVEEHLPDWPVEFRALIIVARESGMRKGEILGLDWKDVLDTRGKPKSIVALRGQWSDREGFKDAKTGPRNVLMTERARAAVVELCATRDDDRMGSRMFHRGESWAWSAWTRFQRLAKIKNPKTRRPYRFHDLRHTAAVELVSAGKIELAQKLLGHKNLNSTLRYSERPAEDVLAEIEETKRNGKK